METRFIKGSKFVGETHHGLIENNRNYVQEKDTTFHKRGSLE